MPSSSKGKSDGSSQPSSSASSSSSSGSRPSFTRSQSGSLQLHNPLAPAARANGGANSNAAGASSPNPATKGKGQGKGKGKGKGKGGALSATEIKLLSGEVVDVGEFQAQEVRALKRQVAAIAKKVYEQGPGSDDSSSSSAGGRGGRRGSGSIEALLRMRGSGGRRRMIDFAVQWPEFLVPKVMNGMCVPFCAVR